LAVILADTDVLIDYPAGVGNIDNVADHAASGQLLTTAITCFELLSGAGTGKRGDAVKQLVAALEIIPLDRDGAAEASRVRRKLDAKGEGIGMADSLIAGIALARSLPLWTRNRKHFGKVENLKLVDLG
jgi:predicted nucleic acid-binding protein